MGKCKNCKYWAAFAGSGDEYLAEHYPDMGDCYNSRFAHNPDNIPDGAMPSVECDIDFMPGKNFGCIHFKKRTKEQV